MQQSIDIYIQHVLPPRGVTDVPSLGQTFNAVFMIRDVHNRHAGYFPEPSLEVGVVRRDDVAAVLAAPLDDAIVCVRPLVHARKSHEPRILGDSERNAIFLTELFEFGDHAVRHARQAFRVQAVHHPFD